MSPFGFDVPWNRVPNWLIAVGLIAVAVVVAVQMVRGDALICADGAVFAKNCTTPPTGVVPRGVVVAFDRDDLDQDTCPKGWTPFKLSRSRVIIGAGDPSGAPGRFGSDENEVLLTRRSLRDYGGTEKHSLTLNEMPSYKHEYEFSSGHSSPRYVDDTPTEFGEKDAMA